MNARNTKVKNFVIKKKKQPKGKLKSILKTSYEIYEKERKV